MTSTASYHPERGGDPASLVLLVLSLATFVSCDAKTQDYRGDYVARVAFMSYSSAVGEEDCSLPVGVVSGDVKLTVASDTRGDFVTFQGCRVSGTIDGVRFAASHAACDSSSGAVQFPGRTYDYLEINFKTGQIEALYSDFASFGSASGQCSQLEGQVRKTDEAWPTPRDQFLKVTGQVDKDSPNYKGQARLDSYLQRRGNGELYLLGLSCTFAADDATGGAAGLGAAPETGASGTCRDRFQGKFGVPSFVPRTFSVTGSALSLAGEFLTEPEPISLTTIDAEVVTDKP